MRDVSRVARVHARQLMRALAGGHGLHLLELMRSGFLFLPLYPGACWMLSAHWILAARCWMLSARWMLWAHLTLELFCVILDASTDSQLGAAYMRRPHDLQSTI